MKQVYMICNAHLDPVWLWEWEEGAAEALSTFRVAADFCEQFDGFVFNHNEAVLYQWVEEYEPALFERIQSLVKEGRWHIMGGWYLQPDCNMPSGESITRQILRGRQYFAEKFGRVPETAINLDPFGHSRGLVQILRKSGFSSYLVCRPGDVKNELTQKDICWKGFDDSKIMVHYADEGYNTVFGKAAETLEEWLKAHADSENGLWLWGVGDHGGGPSRKDLMDLNGLIEHYPDMEIRHGTPEEYFAALDVETLPVWALSLTPELSGCYVSQHRIKQMHRCLEDRLYFTEKLLSMAAMQQLLNYPKKELCQAEQALLDVEFHDILPGSASLAVEEASLHKMGFGMELLSKLRARAMFVLSQGLPKVQQGESTILVYNPHPYEVDTLIECEMVLPQQNFEEGFMLPAIYCNGKSVPSQAILPETSFFIDWRKKVVFDAFLEPCSVTRFDCRFQRIPFRPEPEELEMPQNIYFDNGEMEVVINGQTGTVDRYCRRGKEFLKEGSFSVDVYADGYNSWHFGDPYSKGKAEHFVLMTPEECAGFCAVSRTALPPVHVVEDGAVRMVVEAALKYHSSNMLIRYILPKRGGEMGIEIRMFWQEKEKMAKLSLKTALEGGTHCGQTIWGTQNLDGSGREDVSLRWCGLRTEEYFLTIINRGTYASSVGLDGEFRIPLLRSAGYAASDSDDGMITNMPGYCFTERMDQGRHVFFFWLQGEETQKRMRKIDREAQIHGEEPAALAVNPSGEGKPHENGLLSLDNEAVVMEAMKMAEDSNGFILRIRNSLAIPQTCMVQFAGKQQKIVMKAYEVQTCRFCPITGELRIDSLLA